MSHTVALQQAGPDGTAWTSRNPGTFYPTAVAYGNGAFVAVGYSGKIFASTDGGTT